MAKTSSVTLAETLDRIEGSIQARVERFLGKPFLNAVAMMVLQSTFGEWEDGVSAELNARGEGSFTGGKINFSLTVRVLGESFTTEEFSFSTGYLDKIEDVDVFGVRLAEMLAGEVSSFKRRNNITPPSPVNHERDENLYSDFDAEAGF